MDTYAEIAVDDCPSFECGPSLGGIAPARHGSDTSHGSCGSELTVACCSAQPPLGFRHHDLCQQQRKPSSKPRDRLQFVNSPPPRDEHPAEFRVGVRAFHLLSCQPTQRDESGFRRQRHLSGKRDPQPKQQNNTVKMTAENSTK